MTASALALPDRSTSPIAYDHCTVTIEAWLIDLDGTLYRQLPVRLAMACELALLGPHQMPLIARFRREQEVLRNEHQGERCPYQLQLERTAAALNRDLPTIAKQIAHWMEQRPGKWLRLFRRRSLLAEIGCFRNSGGKTALVSDYPARRKLEALGAQHLFDVVIASGEAAEVRALKPSPQSYLLAAERLGVAPARCLVIGDRPDADGLAAERAGMQFRRIR